MANENFKKNVSVVSKLLLESNVRSAQARKKALEESGTPTTALPPSTNATRQMQQDIALSSGKSGIPNGIGAPDPGEGNPAQMGPLTDPPTDDQQFKPGPQISGMQKPRTDPFGPSTLSQIPGTPGQAPPATATQELPPESNATRQLDADVMMAKKKFGIPHMEAMETMTDKEVVESFVEFVGGVDRAMFLLIADGCPLKLAEALVTGKLDKLDESIRTKLAGIVDEDIHQHAKSGKASDGFKKWYADRMKKKDSVTVVSGKNSDKPSAGWSSSKKDGNDARRNK